MVNCVYANMTPAGLSGTSEFILPGTFRSGKTDFKVWQILEIPGENKIYGFSFCMRLSTLCDTKFVVHTTWPAALRLLVTSTAPRVRWSTSGSHFTMMNAEGARIGGRLEKRVEGDSEESKENPKNAKTLLVHEALARSGTPNSASTDSIGWFV